jgi:hypothetical protein
VGFLDVLTEPASPARRIVVGGDHQAVVAELVGRLRARGPGLDVVAAPADADGLLARELVLHPLPTAGLIVVDGSVGLTPEARRLTRLISRFAPGGMTLLVAGLDGLRDVEARLEELGQAWSRIAQETAPVNVRWLAAGDDPDGRSVLHQLDALIQTLKPASREQLPSSATSDRFRLTVAWVATSPLLPGRAYALQLGEQTASGTVAPLRYRLDLDTGEHIAATGLSAGEIGACDVELTHPLAFSPSRERSAGGACQLTDPMSGELA